MRFIGKIQILIFISTAIYGTTRGQEDGFDPCSNALVNQKNVPVTVYTNGDSNPVRFWAGKFCGAQTDGLTDQYVSLTIKIGSNINCESNKCLCPANGDPYATCESTFQSICVAEALGDAGYKKFLCCPPLKGFDTCVLEHPGLKDKMDQCLLKRGAGSPTDVALKNAQELKNLGVGLTEQVAFVINGQYKCVSNSAYYYWVQTICTMLEQNLAKSIAACKKMGW